MKTYHVNKIADNQLNITGNVKRDSFWNNAIVIDDFSYAVGECLSPKTLFMALYNNKNFYFRYEAEASEVLTFVQDNHKMEVINSERVELFFARDKKLNPYHCLELDAKGRILDYTTRYYRNFDYQWSWKKGHLQIATAEYNTGYVVEGAISLESLKEYGVFKNNEMLTGLFRGYCTALPTAKSKAQLNWISWITPKVEKPDFHIPSAFGRLVFK